MQAVYVPSFPPASPYEAYIILLIIPLMFRLVMVVPPLVDLLHKFGGDAKWFWTRIRSLRIRGLTFLLFNEVLAITLPFILAFYARTIFDPLGWPNWELTPDAAAYVLIGAAVLWLWADLLRVARTRRLLRAVSEQNPVIAKAAVQIAAGARGALDYLRILSPLDMHSDVKAADDVMEGRPAPADETPIQKLGRQVKDQALIAAEVISEKVREKADEVSTKLDARIEESVKSHARTNVMLMLRDVAMSLAPIAVLVALHQLW